MRPVTDSSFEGWTSAKLDQVVGREGTMRILLVDDDAELRAVVADMLIAGGHDVVSTDPQAGLTDALEHGRYDLVVTDLRMPGFDGWDVAHLVRDRLGSTPVMAIGGDLGNRPGDRPLSVFDAILEKPFRRAALLSSVEAVVSKAGR